MQHRTRSTRSATPATVTARNARSRDPRRCPSDAPTPVDTPQVDTWDVDPEQAFLAWLADPDAPEELFAQDRSGVELPVSWLLGMLCASRTPLPDWAEHRLGYRQPRSIGDAATDLLLAVSDPSGPRCPSFAAAKRHLHELDPRSHVLEGA